LSAPAAAPLAWRADGAVRGRAQFAREVRRLASQLPPAGWVVNRCSGRYSFTVAFAAAALTRRGNLLPPSAVALPEAIARQFPDAFDIDDGYVAAALVRTADTACDADAPLPEWPPEQVAAVVFTSGSSGVPQAHHKTWGALSTSARLAVARLHAGAPPNTLATVPSQHMYGLETTVVAALAAGGSFYDGPTLFPRDVAAGLALLPAPRMLVTTPFHLRHLLETDVELSPLATIVSATAPLDAALAMRAEARFATTVQEIYGCTEGGVLATRRTVSEESWLPQPGFSFGDAESGAWVDAQHLPPRTRLADRLAVEADGRFRLVGRSDDLVKVAGKRGSMAEVTRLLRSLPGVEDAAVFQPEDGGAGRLAAFIVAPGCTEAALRHELSARLDPAFLPRPLRIVPSLPHDALGKLPRESLLAMLGAP